MLLTSLFTRLLLRLLPLIVLLCAAIPALGGRSLATNDAWQNFGFSACDLPCYVGITPGRTPFSDTPDLLHRAIPLIGNRMFYAGTAVNFWASLPLTQLSGWARNDFGVVGEMRLTSPLPFDYLLTQLGTPDCAISGTNRPTVVFWIRNAISIGAVLGVGERDFSPSNRISALWLRNPEPNDCEISGVQAWHGFALTSDYAP
ncbi:MAG: hypothetical protein ABI700_14705 [Chloroflexota bacterium]